MHVYFIRNGRNRGAIKIGKANNVEKRLDELQIGNPCELRLVAKIKCSSEKEAKQLEARIHRLFKTQRIRGEWFSGNIKLSKALTIKQELAKKSQRRH